MPFNHYAKIKRILSTKTEWYILQVNDPTIAKAFNGEVRVFDHYYRVFDNNNIPIPYCKFQQLERFASIMGKNISDLVIIENQQNNQQI